MPKIGSCGFGLKELERLGHKVTVPFPALMPPLLRRDGPLAWPLGFDGADCADAGTAWDEARTIGRYPFPLLAPVPPVVCSSPTKAPPGLRLSMWVGLVVALNWPVKMWCSTSTSGVLSLTMSLGTHIAIAINSPVRPLTPLLAPRPPTREVFEHQIRGLFEQRERILGTVLAWRRVCRARW